MLHHNIKDWLAKFAKVGANATDQEVFRSRKKVMLNNSKSTFCRSSVGVTGPKRNLLSHKLLL